MGGGLGSSFLRFKLLGHRAPCVSHWFHKNPRGVKHLSNHNNKLIKICETKALIDTDAGISLNQ